MEEEREKGSKIGRGKVRGHWYKAYLFSQSESIDCTRAVVTYAAIESGYQSGVPLHAGVLPSIKVVNSLSTHAVHLHLS